jgi:hypothetical protein
MAPCWAIVDFSQHSSSFLDVILEKKFLDGRFRGGKKGVVKEDMRFVGIHLLVKVLSMREEIGNSVGVARDMGQFVVEILEVFDPSGLSTSNLLQLVEVLEVFMIRVDLNGVCSSKEKGTTTFEPKKDGGKFFIMGVVVLFGGKEAP